MHKKIVPLFFCLALFTNADAQLSNTASGILGSIKNVIGNILVDSSVTKTCKKSVKLFGYSITAINSAALQTQTKRLISCSKTFQSSYKAATNSCKAKTDSLNKLTTLLIMELKKPPPDSIGVTITFVDSSKNGAANWKLQFDSLAKPIDSFIITDSMGYFQASLASKTNSVFKVKNLVDTNLHVAQYSSQLTVSVSKPQDLDSSNHHNNNGIDITELENLRNTKNILLVVASIL